MPLIRTVQVEGRPIRVYDALISLVHVRKLTKAFLAANFVCGRMWGSGASGNPPVLALGLEHPTRNRGAIGRLPTDLVAVQDFKNGDVYRIYRCYYNHAAYGDMLFTHTDVQHGNRGLTAVWYIVPEWKVDWGGETLFYNKNMDAEVAVTPRARPPRRF